MTEREVNKTGGKRQAELANAGPSREELDKLIGDAAHSYQNGNMVKFEEAKAGAAPPPSKLGKALRLRKRYSDG